jgi:ABC-type amino acid transport substrate-binding protein
MKRLIYALLVLSSWTVTAQENDTLKVHVSELSPFVMESNGHITGFEIEIFETIAKELDWQYEFELVKFKEIVPALVDGSADVGFSAMTITADREQLIDYSQPHMNSEIRILVNHDNVDRIAVIKEIIMRMAYPICLLLGFVLVFAHIMWWAERGKDAISDDYFPGIFEGAWLTTVTMTTVGYGDIAPKKWTGRIASIMIQLTGIAFYGWAIAQSSAILLDDTATNHMNELKDLRGNRISTVENTTSVNLLQDNQVSYTETKTIEVAVMDLLTQRADAVVFDEPTLKYILKEYNNDNNLSFSGESLKSEYFGFAFPDDSVRKEQFDQQLLVLKETGVYDEIKARWFN